MARQERAAFLFDKKKEAIRIQTRLNILYKKRYNAGYIKLEKPERCGWQRFFVLRPDIAKSPQGKRLQRLLDKYLQYVQYSNRKDFTKKQYKTKKYIPMEQSLRHISPKTYEELTPGEKSHFHQAFIHHKPMWGRPTWREEVYVFSQPWQFVLRVKAYYITHKLALVEEVEREIKELDGRFNRGHMWRYMDCRGSHKDMYYNNPDTLLENLLEKEAREWQMEQVYT